MKGMVFVELLQMADSVLGEEAVDAVLDSADLESGGAYSAVGNYPCGELMTLVQAFSDHSGAPVVDLQEAFGKWMLDRFSKTYPAFFEDKSDALEMLEAIEAEVHVEVRKLYPDAELPSFQTERIGADGLKMIYASPRPLAHFCHGLIQACVAHFGQSAQIDMQDRADPACTVTEFTIKLAA